MLKFVKFGFAAAGLFALSACDGTQFKSLDEMGTGTTTVSSGTTVSTGTVTLPSTTVTLPSTTTVLPSTTTTIQQPTYVTQPTYTTSVPVSTTTISTDSSFTIRGTSFALNSDRLLSAGRSQLDSVANTMLSQVGTFSITGYASTEGDSGYNQSLSERRARSVAAYLVGKGVSSSALITSGAGETTQFGSDLASNRRVQITPAGSSSSFSTSGYEVISSTPIYETTVGTPISGGTVIQQPVVISR